MFEELNILMNTSLVLDTRRFFINANIDKHDFPNNIKKIKKEDGTVDKIQTSNVPSYILL
jgi:hypothetical protein